MVGFAVVVGIAVTSHSYHQIFTLRSLLGFLTGFFISGFSMVSNDIYDIGVDRINQPRRPLASGAISLRSAKWLACILLVLGIAVAVPLGLANFAIAALFAFIGWYYNFQGKKLGLFGNSLVAFSLAIPYIYGSIALGNYSVNLGYLLALTSFIAGMGREVLKGIADVQGDRTRNVKTVAISHGVRAARNLVAAFFLAAVASSLLPVLFGLLGNALFLYAGLILIPDGIFLYLTYKVLSMKVEAESLKLKSIALGGMMAGLLAYLISGLFV